MREINDRESNRVLGLRDHSPAEIDEILPWYAQYGVSCNFDIVPLLASQVLLQTLADRGFSKSGYHASLFGVPANDLPESPIGVEVIEVLEGQMEYIRRPLHGVLGRLQMPPGVEGRGAG